MNRTKWLFYIAVVAALAFSLVLGAHASEGGIEYYGRAALSREPNSVALLYAYDQLVAGVESADAEISVWDGAHSLSSAELGEVYDAYTRDHTEHFWLAGSYSYTMTAETVKTVEPTYTMTGGELTAAKKAFDNAVNDMLSGVFAYTEEFERELFLHDKLDKAVTYGVSPNAHNAYGALIEGKGVCEGYAEAFQYLLQRAGIQSFIAIGSSVNPETGEREPHEWNIVRIDGEYYHVDPTWDDQGESIFHAYFNQSDAEIGKDHIMGGTEFDMPVCNSIKAQYFTVRGGAVQTGAYSASEIGARLREGGFSTCIYVSGGVDRFIEWMNENIVDICAAAGITGRFSYRYSYLGNEVDLIVAGATEKHTIETYVEAKKATCTAAGNIDYYICACGKMFFDLDAKNEVPEKGLVTVEPLGHDFSEKISDNKYLSSNGDCMNASEYYFACKRCFAKGTQTWTSTEYGEHNVSAEWYTRNGEHYRKCLTPGCEYVSNVTACYGGTATENSRAICEVCGGEYGELLPSVDTAHADTDTTTADTSKDTDADTTTPIEEDDSDSSAADDTYVGTDAPSRTDTEAEGVATYKTVTAVAVIVAAISTIYAASAKRRRR